MRKSAKYFLNNNGKKITGSIRNGIAFVRLSPAGAGC